MKKRLLAMLLIAAMAISMVACGTKEEAPAEEASAEDVAVEEEVPTEESSDELPECTVTFLHNGTADAESQMWDDFAAEFMDLHPQVTVEVQNGGSDYYSVLATKINADEVPDIYFTGGGAECNTYEEYLYDFRNDEDLLALWDSIKTDDYKATCVTDSGKVVGIPNQTSAYGMIYNKDMFEDAGITELPQTIDEWRDVCEKLVAAGYTPFCNGFKEWWIARHTCASYIASGFNDFSEMYPALTTGGMKIADLPHIQEMYDFLDLIKEYSVDNTMELDAAAATAVLANGEAAIQNNGTWNYVSYVDINPDIRLGFIPEPYNNAENTKLVSTVSMTLSIGVEPENFEATKALYMFFVEKLCTTEAGVNQKCLQLPQTDTSLLTNELLLDAFQYDADKIREGAPSYWTIGFDQEFGALLQEYLIGNHDRDENIAAIQAAWDDLCPAGAM